MQRITGLKSTNAEMFVTNFAFTDVPVAMNEASNSRYKLRSITDRSKELD
jgi:hypothetical protein